MADKNEINLGTFTFDIQLGDILKAGHGILEINSERQKQINKYGFTAKFQAEHPEYYSEGQLVYAAVALIKLADIIDLAYTVEPINWDRERFLNLCQKSQKDRIRIAAALLAAELDRLNYLEINK